MREAIIGRYSNVSGADLIQVFDNHGGLVWTLPASGLPTIFVDVKTKGVVGDGVTDDRVAIQAAIDSLTNGGTVFFPAGIYLVSKIPGLSYCLNVPSNVSLIGVGRGASTIRRAANQPSFTRILNIQSVSNVTIRALTLDGNSGNNTPLFEQQHSIFINASSNVSVIDCELINSRGDHIYWFGGCNKPTVTGCWFDNGFRVGIHTQSFTDGVISDCHFSTPNSNNHIKSELDNVGEGGSRLVITNCTFVGDNAAAGIQISGFSPVQFGFDGSITAGQNTFTALSGIFVLSCIGETVTVKGAGPGGADLVAVITGITSLSTVTLAVSASTTVSNASWKSTGSTVQGITISNCTFSGLQGAIFLGIYTNNWSISNVSIDSCLSGIVSSNYSLNYGYVGTRGVSIGHGIVMTNMLSSGTNYPLQLSDCTDVTVAPICVYGQNNVNGVLFQQCQNVSIGGGVIEYNGGNGGGTGFTFYRSKLIDLSSPRLILQTSLGTSTGISIQDDASGVASKISLKDIRIFGSVTKAIDASSLTGAASVSIQGLDALSATTLLSGITAAKLFDSVLNKSFAWTPTILNNATASQSFAFSGCVIGSRVIVSQDSGQPVGVFMTGTVVSVDNVSISAQNVSGAQITLTGNVVVEVHTP